MDLTGRDIVCIASSSWDSMWVNSQHLMSRLARANRVLYVNNTGLRMPGPSAADLRKIGQRLRNFSRGVRQPQENLHLVSPIVVPLHGVRAVERLNGEILARYLRRHLRKLGMARPVLWIFLPTGLGLLGRLDESLVVYHCVDKYSENPGVSAERIREMEAELCRRADLVLVTSSALYEEQRGFNPQTRYFGNVANVAHFAKALEDGGAPPADLAGIARPILGYQGNIASYKIDLGLLEYLARQRPQWSLVLVGPVGWGDPTTDVSRLRGLPNVHFLDRKDYQDLPRYVRAFDVCLIPFVESDSTQSSFPMKFFEYLAVGKPVVSRRIRSLEPLGRDPRICRLADGPEEFLARVEDSLAEPQTAEIVERRLALARQNDWESRSAEIGRVVGERLAAREGRCG